MRVVFFITEGRVIRRILDHLGGVKRPQRTLRKPSPGGPAPLRCRPPKPFEPVPTISRAAAENQSSYQLINASASSPGPPGVLILEWAGNPAPAARGGDGVRQEEIRQAGRPQGPLARFQGDHLRDVRPRHEPGGAQDAGLHRAPVGWMCNRARMAKRKSWSTP